MMNTQGVSVSVFGLDATVGTNITFQALQHAGYMVFPQSEPMLGLLLNKCYTLLITLCKSNIITLRITPCNW